MRAIAAATFLFLAGATASAEPLDIQSHPITWEKTEATTALLGDLEIASAHVWTSDNPDFGGLSGLLIAEGRLTAVTDRGMVLTGELDGGQLKNGFLTALKDLNGKPLKEKADADAESLAEFGSGHIVSFERKHRLLAYRNGKADPFDGPEKLSKAASNHGLEAITRLNDGRYLLLIEKTDKEDQTKGWIGSPGKWKKFTYVREDGYRPTGATTLPDGRVIILERYYAFLMGVRARLRLIDPEGLRQKGPVKGRLLGEIQGPLPVDNFEAIAATQDEEGKILIHLLSDDNFSALQKTLYLTLRLRNPS